MQDHLVPGFIVQRQEMGQLKVTDNEACTSTHH